MATVQCSKCTAERKGFRRELDSWRHKLIHCVGFESILEGVYGPMLLRDLNLFDDCEPEEVEDWSPEASCSQCSFCNLLQDKLSDQVPAATSPLASPSEYSPCLVSESSQLAHRFLQAVFHKKDVSLTCDSNIPLVAQELMKKMIHQFAMEYASKCRLHPSMNGVTTKTVSPLSETLDGPLDLTVTRTQEEKESKLELDGVLDLSNRNAATSSSSNHKTTGSVLPSEKLGDMGQRGTKRHQSSVLDAILISLCPSHRSLLYQVLKMAQQEKLLSFINCRPAGQTKSYCCHCGVNPQDKVSPLTVQLNECKAHNHKPCYPWTDYDHQGHDSTLYHPGDSKSNCIVHHYPLNDYKSKASLGSHYCCVQRCKMETYPVLCPKRFHCISCQSLAVGHINNVVCSFASSPSLSKPSALCIHSSSLCPSSTICCNQRNHRSCRCYSNHACLMPVRSTEDIRVEDGDPPCPVLKMEQSLSPPPLSPVSSDIDKKTDEKPPSLLYHGQEMETEQIVKNVFENSTQREVGVDAATEEELQCRTPRSCSAEQNPSRMNRFSKKLETIRALEKDPSLVSLAVDVSDGEQSQSSSTSQNLQCHADAHLTEIITKVLHKGSDSDYNLSELFNRHDSTEPKSPNTRSRRRQEVLAAIATPVDDASTRRKTLKIKRELAMLYHFRRQNMPPVKRARLKDGNVMVTKSQTSSVSSLVKEESEREMEEGVESIENHRIGKGPLKELSAKSDGDDVKGEMQRVITEEVQILKEEEKQREISSENEDLTLSGIKIPTQNDDVQTQVMTVNTSSAKWCGGQCEEGGQVSSDEGDKKHNPSPLGQNTENNCKGKDCHSSFGERQESQINHSKDERRSKRNIVPPQRFSSYVTEPRKMFFVACFDDGIFNKKTQKDNILTSGTLDSLFKDPDATNTQLKSRNKACLTSPEHTETLTFESSCREQCRPSITDSKDQCMVFPQTVSTRGKGPAAQNSESRTDCSNCASKTLGKATSSKPQNSENMYVSDSSATCAENSQVQYTSPIKLMFVSPVKDKKGVRYSLKSAGCGSSAQAEEHFDPCEVSSWAGTLEKHKNQIKDSATSEVKLISSPLKSTTSSTRSVRLPSKSPDKSAFSKSKSPLSPAKSVSSRSKFVTSPGKLSTSKSSSPAKSTSSPSKSVSSPAKSASSPTKSVSSSPKSKSPKSAFSPTKSVSSSPKSKSPKSASSSPKIGSRKTGEITPTKRIAGTESQRSPCDFTDFHETTPPKRRPGRPKKLGPQLEQKVKRPIGRPRKQKALDSVIEAKTVQTVVESDIEENVNKNLKITVMYGRSRRNKRLVSECFDQLQTDFHYAWQAVGLKSDLGILIPSSKNNSGGTETASTELSGEFNFVSPVKESAPQSSSNIKCIKRDNSVPSRKPGRPAKVKISGISVTVTTVSPLQRKIQINRDPLQCPETLIPKKIMPELKSAKQSRSFSRHPISKNSQTKRGLLAKDESINQLPNQPVRHSMRVRKPSIHFLHALATSTSRSYSHSNALLRRSKKLLLNKASNERKKEEQQSSAEALGWGKRLCGQEKINVSQDMSRVAGVSVDSIFTPKETLRWWAPLAEEKSMNQELARRIRLISDTWVSDTVETPGKERGFNSKLDNKSNYLFTRKSKHLSVVRTLFDCSPNKPRTCSMQQICSWFMESTETQSLAIVKKASSRNPYELMHFPRSVNKKSVCHSPQAERLRKHIKKFANTVPKSPLQHQLAQRRLQKRKKTPLQAHFKQQLFSRKCTTGNINQGAQWWGRRTLSIYQATVVRARTRFLNRKERERWQRKQNSLKAATSCSNGYVATGLQSKHNALHRSVKRKLSDCLENGSATGSVDQTQEPVDLPKEQNICSKAWSPETLKECRVFLRKINSPDNESAEEEWDSCTVTLDDGSPSAYLFAGGEPELVGVVKAVKTERKMRINRRTASRELVGSAPKSVQEQDELPAGRQKGKYKSPEVVVTDPPPAKMLRQSRMRGLTGPRWCDFVFEN